MFFSYRHSLLAVTLGFSLAFSGCGSESGYYSSTDASSDYQQGSSVGNVDLRTFRIDYQDADHIIFSWAPVEGADGYEVSIARDMLTTAYVFPYQVSEPQINLGDKVPEGTWWIKVKANGSKIGALAEFTITEDNAYINE